MKFIRFEHANSKHVGVLDGDGVVPVEEVNAKRGTRIPNDLLGIIEWDDAAVELSDLRGIAPIPISDGAPQI